MRQVGVLLCFVGLVASGPPVSKTKEEILEFKDALERSRIDDGVLLESRMLANPDSSAWVNSGKYQGDIVLDDTQIENLVRDYATGNKVTGGRNAYVVGNPRWPGNTMIWVFGANQFNQNQQRLITTAMSWIEHFSCVRFRRRTNERVFVTMTGRATGCYASVGFSTVHPNRVHNLAHRGCLHNMIIIHELMHNLGFQHMHQTFGRDNYVRINLNNVINEYRFAFNQFRSNQVHMMGLPYEFTSNMHYDAFAFSRNRQPTITPLRSFTGTMGQMDHVTNWDWLRLRRYYNCPGAWNERDMQVLEEEVKRTIPLIKMNMPAPKKGPFTDLDNAYVQSIAVELETSDDAGDSEPVMYNEDNTVKGNEIYNEDVVPVEDNNEQ